MSAAAAPRSVADSSPRANAVAGAIVILYAVITILPLLWIGATAFKSQSDAIAYPPKVLFSPTLEGFVDLFTVQTRQSPDFIAKLPPPKTWYEKLARNRDMVIAGPSPVVQRFLNSLVIGFGSTFSRLSSERWPPTGFRASGCRWPTICFSSSCRRG